MNWMQERRNGASAVAQVCGWEAQRVLVQWEAQPLKMCSPRLPHGIQSSKPLLTITTSQDL